MNRKFLIPGVILLAVSSVLAQTKNPISSALKDILPTRQKNIVAAAEAMPADKYSYKPTADQMTFGHLATHIVESNYLFCSKVSATERPRWKKRRKATAKTS